VKPRIETASEIGFCYGVRKAILMLEKAAQKYGHVDSLGAVVHNEQVIKNLEKQGVNIIQTPEDKINPVVAISCHGVSPEIEYQLKNKGLEVIDTTCKDVHRAQIAAKELADSGYFVIIFGDAKHPEVKGLSGWAKNNGTAITDSHEFEIMETKPRKIGIIAQTTQVPEYFLNFVKNIIDIALTRDSDIRIKDTICPGIRRRQSKSLELAKNSDLVLVIGGKTSANTRHLFEICAQETVAYLISSADEIQKSWLKGKKHIGVTSGTSTPEEVVLEVVKRLEVLSNKADSQKRSI
jgi:4-hydroxy-3-methylbut-2-enyl diphosphate reductase